MKQIFILISLLSLLTACNNQYSTVTSSKFNDPNHGGFTKTKYKGQQPGPGLNFIPGGEIEIDGTTKKVNPFYMDRHEITNHNWRAYMYWSGRVYTDFPLMATNTKPNEQIWKGLEAYNDPMALNYLNHPAYDNYPVVGVSWLQANNYCLWRSDRVNENILTEEKILLRSNDQQNEPFTTEAYLVGQYENGKNEKSQLLDLDPHNEFRNQGKMIVKDRATRNVRLSDGILLPRYRLPNFNEWQYAAGITTSSKKAFLPWNKNKTHKNHGNSNFMHLAPVDAGWPNDYGLYQMSGNVSEWVMDPIQETGWKKGWPQDKYPYQSPNKLEEVEYDIVELKAFAKNLYETRWNSN